MQFKQAWLLHPKKAALCRLVRHFFPTTDKFNGSSQAVETKHTHASAGQGTKRTRHHAEYDAPDVMVVESVSYSTTRASTITGLKTMLKHRAGRIRRCGNPLDKEAQCISGVQGYTRAAGIDKPHLDSRARDPWN